MRRGSRKHVLDWTERSTFLAELESLLPEVPMEFDEAARWAPIGHENSKEARLSTFGPAWLQESDEWAALGDWWLVHKRGANTPNWDIAVAGTIEGKPGLVLVEAKANHRELSTAGKPLASDASANSIENHARIGEAIAEAQAGWREIDPGVSISRASHYQLANRMAHAWKIAQHGLPVVLVYLGFTGDDGIRDAGEPFSDDDDWQTAFAEHTKGLVPRDLLGRRHVVGDTPLWFFSRSRPRACTMTSIFGGPL